VKNISAFCGQNVEFSNVRTGGICSNQCSLKG
jgi:hypothetical protein